MLNTSRLSIQGLNVVSIAGYLLGLSKKYGFSFSGQLFKGCRYNQDLGLKTEPFKKKYLSNWHRTGTNLQLYFLFSLNSPLSRVNFFNGLVGSTVLVVPALSTVHPVR